MVRVSEPKKKRTRTGALNKAGSQLPREAHPQGSGRAGPAALGSHTQERELEAERELESGRRDLERERRECTLALAELGGKYVDAVVRPGGIPDRPEPIWLTRGRVVFSALASLFVGDTNLKLKQMTPDERKLVRDRLGRVTAAWFGLSDERLELTVFLCMLNHAARPGDNFDEWVSGLRVGFAPGVADRLAAEKDRAQRAIARWRRGGKKAKWDLVADLCERVLTRDCTRVNVRQAWTKRTKSARRTS